MDKPLVEMRRCPVCKVFTPHEKTLTGWACRGARHKEPKRVAPKNFTVKAKGR